MHGLNGCIFAFMLRLYTFRLVVQLYIIYGTLLYVSGIFRVTAPKFDGDSFHSVYGKSVCQVQYQVLPFQLAGKQQKDTRSSAGQPCTWIYSHIDTIEKTYAGLFTGYIKACRHILIRFRKSDLIFPFHYFW